MKTSDGKYEEKQARVAVKQLLGQMEWRQPDQIAPNADQPSLQGEENDQAAGMSAENRPFIEVVLGGVTYRTLFDSGAMISLAGPKVPRDTPPGFRKEKRQ